MWSPIGTLTRPESFDRGARPLLSMTDSTLWKSNESQTPDKYEFRTRNEKPTFGRLLPASFRLEHFEHGDQAPSQRYDWNQTLEERLNGFKDLCSFHLVGPSKRLNDSFRPGILFSIAKIVEVMHTAHEQHIQCGGGIGDEIVEGVLPVVRLSSVEVNHWSFLLPMLDAYIDYPTLTTGSVSLAPKTE